MLHFFYYNQTNLQQKLIIIGILYKKNAFKLLPINYLIVIND